MTQASGAEVIDCTIFYNEFMMLELRLRCLADQVDRFVIAEASRTFSGAPKPFVLRAWLQETFPELMTRITVIEVDDMPANPNAWIRECHQRNAVARGLGACRPNDLILLFDVDEIPDIEQIESTLPNDDIAGVQQGFFYYYFNLRRGSWKHGAASLFKNLTVAPQTARNMPGRPLVPHGGWHFSYVMTPADIATKISAFSHQEFNTEAFTDPAQIAEKMHAQVDLFERDNIPEFRKVALNQRFPSYLVQNREKYADFIL
jgi:beta-1,4-mannosyl-glycoprotein beta-1,4-N-acetylglucosaminyltransferase